MPRKPFPPLSAREKRSLTLWGTIIAALICLDIEERNNGTFSEANRCIRRRVGPWPFRLFWGSLMTWFVLFHAEEIGEVLEDAAASLSDLDPHDHG